MSGILSIAGGFLGAVGALQAGKAADRAGKFQQAVLDQQAASERDVSRAVAEDFRRRGSRARASSIARLSASGAAVEGSPLLVDEAFVKDIALGSARILQGGEVRGTRLAQQGVLARFEGKAAKAASKIRAGQSLLTGFRGAADSFSGAGAIS